MFHRLNFATGYQSGLITIQFDPDYRRNGRFYTIHMEDPKVDASDLPDNTAYPGLKVAMATRPPRLYTPPDRPSANAC